MCILAAVLMCMSSLESLRCLCFLCAGMHFVSYSDCLSQRLYSGWEQKSGRTSDTFRPSFSRRSSFSLSLRCRYGNCLQVRKHLHNTRLKCRGIWRDRREQSMRAIRNGIIETSGLSTPNEFSHVVTGSSWTTLVWQLVGIHLQAAAI